MSLQFHFSDTPPQVFLDSLHELNIPKVFDPAISAQQRANLIPLAQKRLNEWRTELREQIKKIEGRYNKSQQNEAILMLAPYRRLDELGSELSTSVMNLDRTLKAGRALPRGFVFGTKIYGSLESGEWRIGEHADAVRWNEMDSVRTRLEGIMVDYRELERDLKLTMHRAKDQKEDLQNMMKSYKKRTGFAYMAIRVGFVLAIVAGCLWGGWTIFRLEEPLVREGLNPILGGALLIIGTAGAIISIVLMRRHRAHVAQLENNMRAGKIALAELKEEGNDLKREFHPVKQLAKELTQSYQSLRATFE